MRITIGLHGSKEGNRYELEEAFKEQELGLVPDSVSDEFAYALYEVLFDLEVDSTDGSYEVLGLQGVEFADSITINGNRYDKVKS